MHVWYRFQRLLNQLFFGPLRLLRQKQHHEHAGYALLKLRPLQQLDGITDKGQVSVTGAAPMKVFIALWNIIQMPVTSAG